MADAAQKQELQKEAKARGDPTEPPYADAYLPERHNVATSVYASVSAKAKGTTLFLSKPDRELARPPPYRTGWIADDPKYHPYSYFESSSNLPTPLPERSGLPPEIWFPRYTGQEEPKSEQPPGSPSGGSQAGSPPGSPSNGDRSPDVVRSSPLIAPSSQKATSKAAEVVPWVETARSLRLKTRKSALPLASRPRWDTEHQVAFSKGNQELQSGLREYFDKPMKQDGDGIPRLYEQYSMNDRQTRWHDEPADLGEYRRTLFDWIAPTNVNGPKSQQLTSYWRGRGQLTGATDGDAVKLGKACMSRSVSLPAVGKVRKPDEEKKLRQEMMGKSLKSSSSATSKESGDTPGGARTGRRASRVSLGDTPGSAKSASSKASQAEQAEKGLAELCRCVADMPADEAVKFWRGWAQHSKLRIKPKERVTDKSKPRRTRQRLLDNASPSRDDSPPVSPGNQSSRGASPPTSPLSPGKKRGQSRKTWDNRWNVLVSKNNEEVHEAYQQYFTTAEYHSGKEYGHPNFYLAAPEHRWKNMKHHVSLSPSRNSGASPFREPQRLRQIG